MGTRSRSLTQLSSGALLGVAGSVLFAVCFGTTPLPSPPISDTSTATSGAAAGGIVTRASEFDTPRRVEATPGPASEVGSDPGAPSNAPGNDSILRLLARELTDQAVRGAEPSWERKQIVDLSIAVLEGWVACGDPMRADKTHKALALLGVTRADYDSRQSAILPYIAAAMQKAGESANATARYLEAIGDGDGDWDVFLQVAQLDPVGGLVAFDRWMASLDAKTDPNHVLQRAFLALHGGQSLSSDDLLSAVSGTLASGVIDAAASVRRLNDALIQADPKAAVRVLKEEMATHPELDARMQLARALRLSGEVDSAREQYGRLVEESPHSQEAIDGLNAIDKTATLRILERKLRTDTSPTTLTWYARQLLAMGRKDDAITATEEAWRTLHSDDRWKVKLGAHLLELAPGRCLPMVAAYAETASLADDLRAELMTEVGDASWRVGQKLAAMRSWQAAVGRGGRAAGDRLRKANANQDPIR